MSTKSFWTAESAFLKVPVPSIHFWVVKILCTTIGETVADAITLEFANGDDSNTSAEGPCAAVFAGILIFFLAIQLYAQKYISWLYWAVVVLFSIEGTLITDNLVDNMSAELWQTTIAWACALIATFLGWYFVEGTLSIHSVRTVRRETFYWLVVLFTFALGTSTGDWLSTDGLDDVYWKCIVVFVAIFIGVAAIYYILLRPFETPENDLSVLPFWLAYIITRPMGASIGDGLSQSTDSGGLGVGADETSLIFGACIVAILGAVTIYEYMTGMDNGRKVGESSDIEEGSVTK